MVTNIQGPEVTPVTPQPDINPAMPGNPGVPTQPEVAPIREPMPQQPSEVPTPDTGHN